MTKRLSCSIGVMVFNEEANIALLLKSLLKQSVSSFYLCEIIVVASGCIDQTVPIVKSFVKRNPMVTLVVQEMREGKASAINLFLSKARGDVAIIESGDTIPDENAIENLVRPFHDPKVGMTGAHPVPVDSNHTFMGFTVHLFWRLHHELALERPKLGELIAFRKIFHQIPNDTAVDEASIEAMITKAGYRIHYAPDAIVRNKGAQTPKDFLTQRRRIMVGHKHLQMTTGYVVSSMKARNLIGLFSRLLTNTHWNLKSVLWTFGAVFLEILGRLLGDYDYYIRGKNPVAWEIAKSTKDLKSDSTDF